MWGCVGCGPLRIWINCCLNSLFPGLLWRYNQRGCAAERAASSLSWGAAIIGHLIRPEETCRERARVATVISPKHLSQGDLRELLTPSWPKSVWSSRKCPCSGPPAAGSTWALQSAAFNLLNWICKSLQQPAAAPSPAYLCIYLWLFSSDLFVQVSVFVRFIGFPKTGYLDITAVCHDTGYRQLFTNTFCKWQIFMILLPSKTDIQQFCTKQKELLFKKKLC